MRKKTALQNPGNRKTSPKHTKGLAAKGQKPRQPAQEECALDNRSHRTFSGFRTGYNPSASRLSYRHSRNLAPKLRMRNSRLGRRPPSGGRSRKPFC